MQFNDSTVNRIKGKLNGLERQAWKPTVRVGEDTLDASKTSGKAWLKPGEM